MTSKSNNQAPGESKKKQWREIYPERYKEEIELMQQHYADFELHAEDNESVYWTGIAKAVTEDGKVIKELQVKVECPTDYPSSFPRVHDLTKTLKPANCPHLTRVGNDEYVLCYGNRLSSEIDFDKNTRVKDVVDYACMFLAQQWYYEKRGYWPNGQAHGVLPFLHYEVYQGTIDPADMCPCGLGIKEYRVCHMPDVKHMLSVLDSSITSKVWRDARKIGRNEKCPCKKGAKYKKCCALEINYPESKTFLLLKFPTCFGMTDKNRDAFLKQITDTANQIHEAAQK